MTNLIIQGKAYSVEDAIARPTLNDLVAIKRATGLGAETIVRRMNKLAGMPAADVLDDLELLEAFRAFVWMARRAVGESLTLEEANEFGWDEWSIEFDADEDTEAIDSDPGQPAASGVPAVGERNAESHSPTGRQATSKTSKKRS